MIGVEPEAGDDTRRSLAAGERVRIAGPAHDRRRPAAPDPRRADLPGHPASCVDEVVARLRRRDRRRDAVPVRARSRPSPSRAARARSPRCWPGRVDARGPARRRDDLRRQRRPPTRFARAARASSLGAMAWNVRDPRRRLRRPLRRAQARAAAAAARRASVTLVNDVNFMLYTPLLPGAARRHARAAPRRRAAARAAQAHRPLARARHRRRPATRAGAIRHRRRGQRARRCTTTSWWSRSARSRGRCRSRAGRARASASRRSPRRSRCATGSSTRSSTPSRSRTTRRATRCSPTSSSAPATPGVEGLAELQDFAADVVDLYPRCAAARPALRARRGARPRDAGDLRRPRRVRDRRAAPARDRGPHSARPSSASRPTRSSSPTARSSRRRTVAWTAGVKPHPVVARARAAARRRRAASWSTATARSRASTTCGRSATPPRCPIPARPGQPTPPTCQHALRQGRTVGAQRRRRARRRARRKPFTYKTLGVFVDMGRHQAVAETLGIKWRGFPAWFLARTYHLAMMPGISRRLRLVDDWTVGLLFGRDASELGQLGHPPQLGESRPARSRAPAGPRRTASGRPRTRSALSAAALALVLGSAALHALWNALLADAARHARDDGGGAASPASSLFAPVAALDVGRRRRGGARTSLASAALELVYFALLATAYARARPHVRLSRRPRRRRRCSCSSSRSRARAPSVSGWQAAGVLAVAGGRAARARRRARDGARRPARSRSASPPASPATRSSTTTGSDHAAALAVLRARPSSLRRPVRRGRRGARGPRRAARGGHAGARCWRASAMFVAYALALAALELAEAAPVAALRETSVVMATVAAAVWAASGGRGPDRRRGRRRRRRRRDRAGLSPRARRRGTRRRCRRWPRPPSGRASRSSAAAAARHGPPAPRCPSPSSQIRSSGKRIVNVCTERQRGMCSAIVARHLVELREALHARARGTPPRPRAARPGGPGRAAGRGAGRRAG